MCGSALGLHVFTSGCHKKPRSPKLLDHDVLCQHGIQSIVGGISQLESLDEPAMELWIKLFCLREVLPIAADDA
jgi:hypothetical protein